MLISLQKIFILMYIIFDELSLMWKYIDYISRYKEYNENKLIQTINNLNMFSFILFLF